MTQTAIEWLVSELPTIDWDDPYYKQKLQEAKKIEREHIEDAFAAGSQQYPSFRFGFEYYDETFNTTDK